jgi:hypothetical protein
MNPKATLMSAMSAPLKPAFFVSTPARQPVVPGLRHEFRAQRENRL